MRGGVAPEVGAVLAGRRHEIARLDERAVAVATLGHQLARIDAELVDVELIVGEQHEILEVVGRGCRVVRQPVQRIVDALRGERRQRPRLAGDRFICAVGDEVVGPVEVGHVEKVADRPAQVLRRRGVDMRAFQKGEMQRDRRIRFRHHHRHAMIFHDELQLLDEIGLEQSGPGDRRGEVAGHGHMAVGLPEIDLRIGQDGDAYLRIVGAVAVRKVLFMRNPGE